MDLPGGLFGYAWVAVVTCAFSLVSPGRYSNKSEPTNPNQQSRTDNSDQQFQTNKPELTDPKQHDRTGKPDPTNPACRSGFVVYGLLVLVCCSGSFSSGLLVRVFFSGISVRVCCLGFEGSGLTVQVCWIGSVGLGSLVWASSSNHPASRGGRMILLYRGESFGPLLLISCPGGGWREKVAGRA